MGRWIALAALIVLSGLIFACQPEEEAAWMHFTAVNHVSDLVLVDDRLWAATDGGVAVWDVATGAPERVWTTLDGLAHNVTHVLALCEMPAPHVVVGTETGVALFNLTTQQWRRDTAVFTGLRVPAAVTALACTDSHLAVGYADGGVDLLRIATGVWTHFPLVDLTDRSVAAVAIVEPEPVIWIAHREGVSKIEANELTFFAAGSRLDNLQTAGIAETRVQTMAVDGQQNVWLGQLTGLTRITSAGEVTFYDGRSVRDWPFFPRVDGLAVTENGTLWTNTAFGGVCHFDPVARACVVSFDDAPGMAGSFNNAIVVAENGRVYYGSNGGGISAFNGEQWQQWQVAKPPAANAHRALSQGTQGEIWLGGHYGGYRFTPDAAPEQWQPLDGPLAGIGVNVFHATEQGMWVGHDAGASFFAYEREAWAHLSTGNFPGQGIAGGRVTAIAQDGNSHFWFGTTAGVTVWDGRSFTYFDFLSDEARVAGQTPHLVFDLQWLNGAMWAATNRALFQVSDDGIVRYDAGDLNVVGEETVVRALAVDENDSLLIAVNDQIMRREGDGFAVAALMPVDVATLTVLSNGEVWAGLVDDRLWRYDGERWGRVNEAGAPQLFYGRHLIEDAQGRLWFAGGKGGGLSRYQP